MICMYENVTKSPLFYINFKNEYLTTLYIKLMVFWEDATFVMTTNKQCLNDKSRVNKKWKSIPQSIKTQNK